MSDDRQKALDAVLDRLKMAYENGDKSALLQAIEFCGLYKLAMPDWVAFNYTTAYRCWLYLDAKTLDEAFDVEKPKGFHAYSEREEQEKAFDVYMALLDAEKRGIPIHQNGAIAEVCQQFGINRDKAWKWYKSIREKHPLGRVFDSMRPKIRKKSKKG